MRALVIPCPPESSPLRPWGALGALPVGPELQLHHLLRWIKAGGVEDVDVLLADLTSARVLFPVCSHLGANLHLCPDANATASHLQWILGQRHDRFLVVPEDFHPAAGSVLRVSPFLVKEEQLRPAQQLTLYRPRILQRRTLARLAGTRMEPAQLEPALLTGQDDSEAEPVHWSDAHLLRHPAAYLEACFRAQRRSGRSPSPRIKGLTQASIEGTVQIAPSAAIGRGARLRNSVVLPGTPIADGESLDRVIAFGAKRVQTDGAPSIDIDPERLRLLPTTGRTPLVQRAAAAVLLAMTVPLLLLSGLAVRLESRGPALYRQLRLGQDRRFRRRERGHARMVRLYKLRTMRWGADMELNAHSEHNAYGAGPFFKLAEDPRVTRVGGWLRRFTIDELPQLINVVCGDLALVGNRPLPLYEGEQLRGSCQSLRYDAPAGLTGLWQVLGRSNPDWRQRQFLDSYYAIHRSAGLDTGILARTLPAVLTSRGGS